MPPTEPPTEQETSSPRRMRWTELLVTWAVITIVTAVAAVLVIPRLMPHSASSTMHLIILTMLVFSIAAAPVGSLVYATLFYGILHWRGGSGDEPPPDGPPHRGNTPLIAGWLTVSAALCMFLLIWGLAAMASDDALASHSTMTVDVTAQQWLWTFHYPGTRVTTDVLVVPEGRTVTFDVTSLDVTHGFWIVQMGVKVDANPGEVTTVSVTPDQVGTFTIVCSELCGLNHAYMRTKLRVLPLRQYEAWMHAQVA
ncbi:MAG: cytochrome c oxidase subunit II [Acidimicrobiales bacterium]